MLCSLGLFSGSPAWSNTLKVVWIFCMYTLVFSIFTTLRGDARHCGLSACRIHNLVENNLHGQLAVTSPPGEGLCYRIRLPLQPPL